MNGATLVLALLCGHELPDGVVERGVQVVVRRQRLEVHYQLGLSPATARQQLRQWGVQFDEQAPVFPLYRQAALPRLAEGLMVQVDGVPHAVRPVSVKEVRRHHARVECLYEVEAPQWDGRLRRLEVRDDNFPSWPGGRQVAIKARDSLRAVSAAPEVLGREEPREWSQLTPVAREQSRRLQAWIGEPGDRRPIPLWPWLIVAAAALAPLRAVCLRGSGRRPAGDQQAVEQPELR